MSSDQQSLCEVGTSTVPPLKKIRTGCTDRQTGEKPKLCWEYNKLQLYGEVNARFIKIKHPTQFWLYCLLFVLMTTTLQWRRARSGSHGIAIYPLIKTNQTKQIAYYNTNHRK